MLYISPAEYHDKENVCGRNRCSWR